jgi:hypothetical protein
LMKFFNKTARRWNARSVLESTYKIIISCVLMAAVIYGCLRIFNSIFDTQTFFGLLLQTAFSALIGAGIYFGASLLYKLPEPVSFMKKIFKKGYDTEQY